ncbi:phage tail tape measure protein [Bacillus sp. FJAT-26390]|uniref:phage tail tape measure protein n=1 Tax=Bacillus sp. FJAT-26390 TaxID=1743142 RepID=UPI0011475FC2|nr:phage tail tape measure protein [Bacillus sp. FJAT-26390]
MFGNDMTRYLRDVEQLERRMRDLQNAGGPGGGGGGGGGALGGGAMLGGAAVVAGAGIAAVAGVGLAGAAVFNMADDYQSALAQIQVGTGAAKADMAGLGDTMVNIYNNSMGENFMDIANSLSQVQRVTQLSGDALESTTKNAIAYRDAFGEDITESIKAADTMMKNFGISSDEAYSLLAQGAQGPLSKTMDLLDTANEYSSYFSKLGFSANQMFDTFAAGLEAGAFSLDKVGDGIKEFGIRTKDGSKGSMDAYKALGLSGTEMTAQFAAGGQTAQEAFLKTSQAISAIKDPVVANAVSVQLFGTQAEDLESRVVQAMTSARSQFDMTKYTMGEVAKIKYGTIGKAFEGIGRQLQTGLLLPISKAALPLLEKFSGFLSDAMPGIQAAFGKIGAAVGPVFEKISGIVSGVWDSFGGGDAASGMGSYIDGLIDYWHFFSDSVMGIWDMISPHVMSVMGSIGKIIKQIFPIVFAIGKTFQQVMTKVVSAVMPVVGYLMSKLFPVLSTIFSFLANEVMPVISGVIAAILPKIMMVGDKIAELFTVIWEIIKPIVDGIFDAFNVVFPIIQSIVSNAITAIGGILSGLFDVLGGIIDFVTGVFTGNWGKAWEGVRSVFEGIFSALGSVLKFPIDLAIDAINAAIRGINKVSFDVPEWLGGGTFGVDIPEIPKIGGYADGGYVTQPELAWVGEGKSNEWIIPENNSQRSRDLWQSAGSSMGLMPQGGGDTYQISYSPNIIIQGNADERTLQRAVSAGHDDFERRMDSYIAQQSRVSMK